LPLPTSMDDPNLLPWAFALRPLLLPQPLVNYAKVADWHALLGFNLWDIDQSLDAGAPPSTLTLLRGRFDASAIRTAWSNQGYRQLDVDGITVASLHEDASFDVSSELGRYAFARFNNAAILPDGTLAYAPTLDEMRGLIAVAKGTAPSLGDRPDVAALVGAIGTPLASATLLAGTALQGTPDALLEAGAAGTPDVGAVASQVAEYARMPPILMALLGVTPGGPLSQSTGQDATPQPDIPPARFEIALLFPNQDAAQTAAQVATDRLGTARLASADRPLTDFFSSWQAQVLPDAPVLVLELDFAPGIQPAVWAQMLFRRDLVFLAW
jgi:hypothetical protein